MDNIDDILYSPISSEPETENNDLAQDQTISAELPTPHNPGAEWAWRKWCHANSQLQQNLSQNYGQLNQQPINNNFNQQAAQQTFQTQSLQQWASQNQTLAGLMSSQPLLNQLASQQAAQQTLDMVISDWWINTSLPNEE